MEIFEIRKTLEASVKKKFKANVTDAGTLLDGTEADFAFEVNDNRYNITIRKNKDDLEDMPEEVLVKTWEKK